MLALSSGPAASAHLVPDIINNHASVRLFFDLFALEMMRCYFDAFVKKLINYGTGDCVCLGCV